MHGVETIVQPFAQAGGTEYGYLLKVQGRGTITKAIVVQLTGNLDGFTWTVYNSSAACPPGANPTTVAEAASVPHKLYRVMGPVAVAANSSEFTPGGTDLDTWPNESVFGCFIPYHNVDSAVAGVQVPGLYIKLNVAGTGAKTFGFAFTTCQWQF